MQMIDVYATAGVFLDKHQLALDLVATGMLIDKVHDAVMARENTAAFIHELPSDSVASDCVRVQVLSNAGSVDRTDQIAMIARLRAVIARAPGNPPPETRIWVLFTEAS